MGLFRHGFSHVKRQPAARVPATGHGSRKGFRRPEKGRIEGLEERCHYVEILLRRGVGGQKEDHPTERSLSLWLERPRQPLVGLVEGKPKVCGAGRAAGPS